MFKIDHELKLEKIDINKESHIELLNKMNEENLENHSFIWNFFKDIQNRQDYLNSNELINSPFAITANQQAVGYIEISQIYPQEQCIDIVAIALLLHERGKGYASKTLLKISKYLLLRYKEQIRKIREEIDPDNLASIQLAKNCGFKTYDTEKQARENGIYVFEKKITGLSEHTYAK